MYLRGDEDLKFKNERPRSRPGRVAVYLVLIAVGLFFLQQIRQGEIQPIDPFAPTPTPTRTARSWAEEGAAQFLAGDLEAAIEAYRQAALLADDARLWAELARVQAYSSLLLPTDAQRYARFRLRRARVGIGPRRPLCAGGAGFCVGLVGDGQSGPA